MKEQRSDGLSYSVSADAAALSFDSMIASGSFETDAGARFSDDDFHFHNAGTCPECGGGLVRSGACFSCPVCGFGSCAG
jgi:hypothetical protein